MAELIIDSPSQDLLSMTLNHYCERHLPQISALKQNLQDV
jgi:hypothetical protein